MSAEEFLRRFLLHVLPDRFVRIRYFGFFSNGHRSENIAHVRELLGRTERLHFRREREKVQRLCPDCRAALPLEIERSLSLVAAALRSPPVVDAA